MTLPWITSTSQSDPIALDGGKATPNNQTKPGDTFARLLYLLAASFNARSGALLVCSLCSQRHPGIQATLFVCSLPVLCVLLHLEPSPSKAIHKAMQIARKLPKPNRNHADPALNETAKRPERSVARAGRERATMGLEGLGIILD